MTQIINVALIVYFVLIAASMAIIGYRDPARFRRLLWIGFIAFWRQLGRALGWAVALLLAYFVWRFWL